MTTFAHTETSFALDPIACADASSYRKFFNAAAISGWTVGQVPDGTQHGAASDGQGGWVNPVKPNPPRPALPATDDFKAIVRAKASKLFNNGQPSEAFALLATINKEP